MLKTIRAAMTAALLLLAPAQAWAEPALWRYEDEDSVVWLFGTVHALPPDLEWRSPRIDRAFAEADTIYFETDLEGGIDAFLRLIVRHGLAPADVGLYEDLGPEAAERLRRLSPELGLPAGYLDRFEPWLALMAVEVAEVARWGWTAAAGVETILGADVMMSGKTLAYLETPERHLATFTGMPRESQLAALRYSLETLESEWESEPGGVDIDALWAAGETDALLDAILAESWPGAEVFFEHLLYMRNREWADQIETIFAGSGTVFIAVGAGHMPGEDGLIALLRARGYDIEGP